MTSSASPRTRRRLLRAPLAVLATVLMVIGGHFWMIDRAGSPVPVHDQWLAEGEMLYLPLLEHRLTLTPIVHPHAEHIIVPTRLLALALFELNQQRWDVKLQMTVNAFLLAAFGAWVVHIASRQLSARATALFALGMGGLLASPLFYGNALWGFQSQFYFLLLFSVAHLDVVLRHRVGSVAWYGGVACSLLATVSMGSGFLSAVVVIVMMLGAWVRDRTALARREAGWNVPVHAAIVLTALLRLPGMPPIAFDLGATVHTFLHCLSWPNRFYTSAGAWIWIPFFLLLGSALRQPISPPERLLIALGLWVLAQIAAISVARSAPAIVITPRYYEILWLGLAVNVLSVQPLWLRLRTAKPWLSLTAVALASVWMAGIAYKSVDFAQNHGRYDLPAMRAYADSQTARVRDFLRTDDVAVLQAVPYPQVPHPEPGYLAKLLRNAKIRAVLPTELSDVPSPGLGRAAAALRSTGVVWTMVGFALMAGALLTSHRVRNVETGVLPVRE